MSQLLILPASIGTFSTTLKTGFSIGLLGVSSVSAAVATWQNKNEASKNEIKEAMKPIQETFTKTIPNFLKGEIIDGGSKIFQAYGSWHEKIEKDTFSTSNPLFSTLKTWEEAAVKGIKAAPTTISKNSSLIEEVNYYIFEIGNIVLEVLPHIKTILADTMKQALNPENSEGLISIQKIEKIIKDSGFNDLSSAVSGMASTLPETIGQINQEQIDTAINVLKNLKDNDIAEFEKKVKGNADQIKNEKEKYKDNPEELMKVLLLGKDYAENLKKEVETLTNAIKAKKENLKSKLGNNSEAAIQALETALEGLKNKLGQVQK
ncbi:hypothetical protein [Candidatus Mycoplasma haematohominis]|uniref:hypothetical protein n=1 Tax=Candidatus Mycoplasma haematohominis TaxID=1494318 RepID=UPI001C0A6D0E|nr:hypothetical protein [Candidatus Mycoplasma haemohominis]